MQAAGFEKAEWSMSSLVVPSNIPWHELKGEVLEEFLFWLLDSMSAKDLEWRRGGAQTTTADGGRDLEASFHVPGPDGTVDPQRWWFEVKGRSRTVEPAAVQAAVLNAANRPDLDCLVIVTNTQFSNPCRDWVTQWQLNNPRPKVRLWDRATLERMVVKYPSVVARFAPEALSLDGRLEALRVRFWNQLYFPGQQDLGALWDVKDEINWSVEQLIAIVAGELANGDVRERPWLGRTDLLTLAHAVGLVMVNLVSLLYRAERFGVSTEKIVELGAYLASVGIARLPPETVSRLIEDPWEMVEDTEIPQEAREFVREAVLERIRRELLDACSRDCERVFGETKLEQVISIDETYWHRFSESSTFAEEATRRITIQDRDAPCKIGFPADRDNGCPLLELPKHSPRELISIFRKVIEERSARRK